MALLVAGLLLFAGAHLYPSVLKTSRDKLVAGMGENPYRGIFSIVIVVSLVMIVLGWRSATPTVVYNPPLAGSIVVTLAVFVAFVLFFASQTKTNIKRFTRHPQMMGVIVWSIAHLLVNGDSRSVALFGGLGTWAVLEILFCNRRDGEWQKPAPSPVTWDIATVVIGAVAFTILLLLHEKLFNVAPYMG